jgi:hypothetical protein
MLVNIVKNASKRVSQVRRGGRRKGKFLSLSLSLNKAQRAKYYSVLWASK